MTSNIKLINVQTLEYPVSLERFKSFYPTVIFPAVIDFEAYGHSVVFPVPRPQPTVIQVAVEGQPVYSTEKAIWEETWTLQPKFADLTQGETTITKAQQEAEAIGDDHEAQYIAMADQAEEILEDTLKSGFIHASITWHCDPIFQSQIQGFVLGFLTGVIGPSETVEVRDKMNTIHHLNQTQLTALASALMLHVRAAYATCWATKDAFVPV